MSSECEADSQHPPLQDSVDVGLREGVTRLKTRERWVVHLRQEELHTCTGSTHLRYHHHHHRHTSMWLCVYLCSPALGLGCLHKNSTRKPSGKTSWNCRMSQRLLGTWNTHTHTRFMPNEWINHYFLSSLYEQLNDKVKRFSSKC